MDKNKEKELDHELEELLNFIFSKEEVEEDLDYLKNFFKETGD